MPPTAPHAAWVQSPPKPTVPRGEDVLLEMTKEVDSSEARLVVTTWTVDEFGATAQHPVGTTMVSDGAVSAAVHIAANCAMVGALISHDSGNCLPLRSFALVTILTARSE